MSDIGVAEIPVADGDELPLPPIAAPANNALLDGPILRTLLRLAWPNVIALGAGTCVVIAETSYIGRLGVEPLAAMALVFPFVILTMTMSGGAMGGGVSSAIARALGAGDRERANALAAHALADRRLLRTGFHADHAGVWAGTSGKARRPRQCAGARDRLHPDLLRRRRDSVADEHACAILRGTGNMKLPSLIVLNSAACQIILGGILGLGLGPVPQFGMRGVAAGSLTAFTIAGAIMAWYIFSGRARVTPRLRGLKIQRGMFFDILKVGAVACFSPLQSVLTITIFTHMLAQFGTEILAGYGIGARLEFLLTSIAFSVGIASVPMVGMAIGAGRIARARRIAWIAGWVSFISVGALGTLATIFPDLWVNIFTHDPGVRAASQRYLSIVAPLFAFLGLSIAMYFSSQGAAKVLGPVLAQTARLLFVAGCGWWLTMHDATAANFFALAAASMVVLGLLSASSVMLTQWGPKGGPVPEVRPVLS